MSLTREAFGDAGETIRILYNPLCLFVEWAFEAAYGADWNNQLRLASEEVTPAKRNLELDEESPPWNETRALFKAMHNRWRDTLKVLLSDKALAYTTLLRDFANKKYAHSQIIKDRRELLRFLEHAELLLRAIATAKFKPALRSEDQSRVEEMAKRVGPIKQAANDAAAEIVKLMEPADVQIALRYPSAREIFEFKLTQNNLLRIAGKHYYRDVDEDESFPLIARRSWLPEAIVELSTADRYCSCPDLNPKDAESLRLPLFEGRTCAEWSKILRPEMRIDPGYSYRLMDIKTETNGLKLLFRPTDYLAYYNTCETLAFELADWCYKHPGQLPVADNYDLPLRSQPDRIYQLTNRNAAVGVSALMVCFGGPSGNQFYLHNRTAKGLAEAQGTCHVAPAGSFQPDSYDNANHDRDFSLCRTTLREFAEEMLGQKDVEAQVRDGKDFMEHPKMRPYAKALADGNVKLAFLGAGFSPITTKPEFLVAVLINAKAMGIVDFVKEFPGNWETKDSHFQVPWSRKSLWERAHLAKMLPAGSACLLMAHRLFDELSSLIGAD